LPPNLHYSVDSSFIVHKKFAFYSLAFIIQHHHPFPCPLLRVHLNYYLLRMPVQFSHLTSDLFLHGKPVNWSIPRLLLHSLKQIHTYLYQASSHANGDRTQDKIQDQYANKADSFDFIIGKLTENIIQGKVYKTRSITTKATHEPTGNMMTEILRWKLISHRRWRVTRMC
jgi:hypothetical protein